MKQEPLAKPTKIQECVLEMQLALDRLKEEMKVTPVMEYNYRYEIYEKEKEKTHNDNETIY